MWIKIKPSVKKGKEQGIAKAGKYSFCIWIALGAHDQNCDLQTRRHLWFWSYFPLSNLWIIFSLFNLDLIVWDKFLSCCIKLNIAVLRWSAWWRWNLRQKAERTGKKYCKEGKEAGKEVHTWEGWLLKRPVSEAWGGIFPTTDCYWSLEQRVAEPCILHTQHPQAARNITCVLSVVGWCNKGVQCQWGMGAGSLFLPPRCFIFSTF